MRILLVALLLLAAGCGSPKADSDVTVPGPDLTPDAAGADAALPDATTDVAADQPLPDGSEDASEAADDTADSPDGEDVQEDMAEPFVWPVPVPMQVVDGLPLIEGSIDGSESQPFVLDTLSQICFVDEAIVGDFLYHEVDAVFGNDAVEDLLVKGRDLELDEIFLGLDIGGLIGQAYLQKAFVVLDYVQGEYYATQVAGDPATLPLPGHEGEPVQAAPVAVQNAFPVISPELAPGLAVPLLADTSARMTIITRKIFDQIDDGTLPQVAGYRYMTKYGEDPGFLTRLPSVRIGELEVTGLEAVVIPDDHHTVQVLEPNGVFVEGYVGGAFWSRFAVAVDAFGGDEFTPQVYTFIGTGEDPAGWEHRWDKVGVELTLREGLVTVEMVYEGTDAEAQGLEPGDMLVQVDDEVLSASDLSLAAIRDLLRGEPGTTRDLVWTGVNADEPEAAAVLVEEILP